jgi:hypothetical protein
LASGVLAPNDRADTIANSAPRGTREASREQSTPIPLLAASPNGPMRASSRSDAGGMLGKKEALP